MSNQLQPPASHSDGVFVCLVRVCGNIVTPGRRAGSDITGCQVGPPVRAAVLWVSCAMRWCPIRRTAVDAFPKTLTRYNINLSPLSYLPVLSWLSLTCSVSRYYDFIISCLSVFRVYFLWLLFRSLNTKRRISDWAIGFDAVLFICNVFLVFNREYTLQTTGRYQHIFRENSKAVFHV